MLRKLLTATLLTLSIITSPTPTFAQPPEDITVLTSVPGIVRGKNYTVTSAAKVPPGLVGDEIFMVYATIPAVAAVDPNTKIRLIVYESKDAATWRKITACGYNGHPDNDPAGRFGCGVTGSYMVGKYIQIDVDVPASTDGTERSLNVTALEAKLTRNP